MNARCASPRNSRISLFTADRYLSVKTVSTLLVSWRPLFFPTLLYSLLTRKERKRESLPGLFCDLPPPDIPGNYYEMSSFPETKVERYLALSKSKILLEYNKHQVRPEHEDLIQASSIIR